MAHDGSTVTGWWKHKPDIIMKTSRKSCCHSQLSRLVALPGQSQGKDTERKDAAPVVREVKYDQSKQHSQHGQGPN